jgi:hypothetical protein
MVAAMGGNHSTQNFVLLGLKFCHVQRKKKKTIASVSQFSFSLWKQKQVLDGLKWAGGLICPGQTGDCHQRTYVEDGVLAM